MFEMIGLAIATACLFAFALLCSAVLTALTWLSIRKQDQAPRKRLALFGLAIPIAAAAYFWLCTLVLPGESLFGDISEPLPNGWVIEALGKMPDFANIKDPKSPWRSPDITQCIGTVAVDGDLVVGQYSHPCDTFTPVPNEPYFIFDTKEGTTTEYASRVELQDKLGNAIKLTDVQFFQSPLAATRRRIVRVVEFTPPSVALLVLIALIWHYRTRTATPPRTLYT